MWFTISQNGAMKLTISLRLIQESRLNRDTMFAELIDGVGEAPAPIGNEEYRERQNSLLSQLEDDSLLIVCSRPPAIRTNDVEFPYRNNSDMMYLCGWNDEDSVLIARKIDTSWSVELFVQPRDVLMEIWNGRRPGTEGAEQNWPIDKAHSIEDLEETLQGYLVDCSRVYLRTKLNTEVDTMVDLALTRKDRKRQHFGAGPTSVEDPSQMIAELRLIKSDAEISQMRHASEISGVAHVAAMKSGKPGVGEWQLQAIIEGFFRYAGASGIAYPSIVGCGDNATILHYSTNNMRCSEGEVVLVVARGKILRFR